MGKRPRFKVGGKMFAVVNLEGGGRVLAMKCSPEESAVLTEQDGIFPARYLARASWVSLTRFEAMPPAELRRRLRESYEIVLAKLWQKKRLAL